MKIHGRGATSNPPNRFERLHVQLDQEHSPTRERTVFLRDNSQTLITHNDSPDIGFSASINPYRGCEHGCAYCYARPYHEYLGFSPGLDFETRIVVKPNAPDLLRRELSDPSWRPEPLAMSGVTDCYQPVERQLEITRGCLAVLAAFRQPVGIVTKNHLVTRDGDLLQELAAVQAASVHLSMTTLDADLSRVLEPRASLPSHRLDAIARLRDAGIPVAVAVAPIIPGLNDHEIPAILRAAKEAGAQRAAWSLLRLPHAVKDIFADWLAAHRPDAAAKILDRIRATRGGQLNDSQYGNRMRGSGIEAEAIARLFAVAAQREGLLTKFPALSTKAFRNPDGRQMEFDGF